MGELIQLLIAGLTIGVIYALVAAGYSVIFSATGMINFALGGEAILSAYFGYVWLDGWPVVLRWIVGILVAAAISLLSWRFLYRRAFRTQGTLAAVIVSFAFAIGLQEVVRLAAGPALESAPSPFGAAVWHVTEEIALSAHTIATLVGGTILITVVILAFRTRQALVVRAMLQDDLMARVLGVRVERINLLLFVVSGALVGIGGLLFAPIIAGVTPFTGFSLALTGFVGAALGGLGGVSRAMMGGLLLGLIQSLFAGYVSAGYQDALVFGLLAVVLIVRPAGLLGKAEISRV